MARDPGHLVLVGTRNAHDSVYMAITADINHFSLSNLLYLCIAQHIPSLGTRVICIFQVHKSKINLTICYKLLMQLPYHKYCICCTFVHLPGFKPKCTSSSPFSCSETLSVPLVACSNSTVSPLPYPTSFPVVKDTTF